MSESLYIDFCMEEKLNSKAFESLLRYCFDDLECSRSSPDSDDTSQIEYITSETSPDVVREVRVDDAISAYVRADHGALWFWYDDLNVGIHRSPDPNTEEPVGIPTISLLIDEWYTKPRTNEYPELIPEFVHGLYDYLSPMYVYGDMYLGGSELTKRGIERGELQDLFWVNGFGPEMVDTLGRERVLEAPAWRVEEREDGGVFLWLSEYAFTGSSEYLKAVREHFGLES